MKQNSIPEAESVTSCPTIANTLVRGSTGKKSELINTFIKPSKIHGLGLFAQRDIKKGEGVVQGYADFNFHKEWVDYAKKWKLKSFAHNNGYCMINHSEDFNTVRNKDFEIIASRNIVTGEEITEDYNALSDNDNPFINTLEEFIYHSKRR